MLRGDADEGGDQRECHVVRQPYAREHVPKGAGSFGWRTSASAADAPLDEIDHRMQRAVLVEGRAEEASPRRFGQTDALAKSRQQARLADAALARNQHRPPLSVARECPTLFQMREV